MAEPRRTPVVTAAQVRERLAAAPPPAAATTGPAHEPVQPPVSDYRRRCRNRVALLDYFDLGLLQSRRPPKPSGQTGKAGAKSVQGRRASLRALLRSVFGRDEREGEAAPHVSATTGKGNPPDIPADLTAELSELDTFVLHDCELVTTQHGPQWRLRLPVRHEVVQELGATGLVDELARPGAIRPGDDDVTHHMARRLLEGERELSGLSASELSGILRARQWLAPLGLDLPTEPAIRAALDLANVLAPLRAVAGPDFVGRERELALLEEHLRGDAPDGVAALALHGPGGVGKSTLLARFVLDHVGPGTPEQAEQAEHPLLFSYLSFDRAELDPRFPLTLLSEAARQLSLQAAQLVEPLTHVRRQIDELLVVQTALRSEETTLRGSSTRDVGRQLADAAIVASSFADAVGSVSGDTPVLLVLDTFEMAQRRSRSFLRQLDEALQRMQRRLPHLRVVVAGRAPVEELTVRNLALGGLDEAQAETLLTRALRGQRVDRKLVRLIVERVSGNPLSLRLAADLAIRTGPGALSTGRGRRRLLYDLRAEQVQGVLYRRILDHVAKPVRPLASPGLVVRQITPEVIRVVLAEPCGLGAVTPARAAELFESLRHEVALVTEARPGVLTHRADVRREMLPLLEAEDADRVREIHERAVDFYAARSEIDDHVEHLYHRLMLGQPSSTLDAVWQPAAGSFLEDAWDELPPESRVYLAGRLGREADPGDLAAADRIAWIRQATTQARALLDAGQPRQALRILQARDLVPRNLAVTRLVVEALAAENREGEALAEARAAITEADERGLGIEFVQLNLLAARIAEDCAAGPDETVGFEDARLLYQEARQSALDFGARIEAMTAGVAVLRVIRRSGVLRRDPHGSRLRDELLEEAGTLTDRERSMHPGLLRDLAAELGDDLPDLLVDAARSVGVEAQGRSARRLPEVAQRRLRGAASSRGGASSRGVASPPAAAPSREVPMAPLPPPVLEQPVTSTVSGRSVAEALTSSPGDEELKESLKGYWQSEADRPSFDYNEEGKADRE